MKWGCRGHWGHWGWWGCWGHWGHLGSWCQGNLLIHKVQAVILTHKAQKSQKRWKKKFENSFTFDTFKLFLPKNDFVFLQSKISAKAKSYILSRAKLLCSLCHETPCRIWCGTWNSNLESYLVCMYCRAEFWVWFCNFVN